MTLEQNQIHRIREDSDRRFQQLAEQVNEVFRLTEKDGTFLYVSPAFERIWGRRRPPCLDFSGKIGLSVNTPLGP
ncbi:PAS domain S-box protein [Saccharospirillum sp.]|uniref:PAS domain S-box protein n=1 Tax=Saccharospirillum sp. TaxID=2033801 RepID=UPI0034A0A307